MSLVRWFQSNAAENSRPKPLCLIVSEVRSHAATEIDNVHTPIEARRGDMDELIRKAERIDERVDQDAQCRDVDWTTGSTTPIRPRNVAMHIANVIDNVRIRGGSCSNH